MRFHKCFERFSLVKRRYTVQRRGLKACVIVDVMKKSKHDGVRLALNNVTLGVLE